MAKMEIKFISLTQDEETKICSWFGLARRAGKLAVGYRQVCLMIEQQKVKVLVIAGDAGASIKREILRMAEVFAVPVFIVLDKNKLGHCIGRDSLAVVAMLDEGMSIVCHNLLATADLRG